ncbi:MAG: ATP-dependent helicase, partial [Clostridiales bacterium]|nr:ATP-dependent helicase [Clostridiales bacterium]
NLRTILYYWTIKGYIQKGASSFGKKTDIVPSVKISSLQKNFDCRIDICKFLVNELYKEATELREGTSEEISVQFSLLGLFNAYQERPQMNMFNTKVTSDDIEDSLLYLSKIGAVSLEGGFLVIYSAMELKRLITDNRIQYKVDDYRMLSEFYKQKIQQIHIVGEYANLMVRDYEAALKFVRNYFQMDFKQFIAKYFKGERGKEINRNITPDKYNRLFNSLSEIQSKIINDDESKYIVTAAGPGSGKTRVLVHKLAALVLLEDVKHEQLLMLTFSRAAATEFKKKLLDLIGNAANFIEIKTFHSFCFDLLGKVGSLEHSENVVRDASLMIASGEVEIGRIAKSVVVIDEAQDMDENEFFLIQTLMKRNEDMRVIAVGDDDQNIYEFRGSNSKYLKSFVTDKGARMYEMTENYRSRPNIVTLANAFATTITNRLKADPIKAVQTENGVVQLIHHASPNLEEPVVNHILSTDKSAQACVLTCTNDEALRVVGLLTKHGVRARLIQANDGFRLYNLSEIRFFIKEIDRKLKSPVISDDIWNDAIDRLKAIYANSNCLDICFNLISDFETTNPVKYRTDLEEFIKESDYDDFFRTEEKVVFVSTIHKSKGREFDVVYMMLSNMTLDTNEKRRQVYVGLTRAKNELYIHYNNNLFGIFGSFRMPGVEWINDDCEYPEPEELVLQLSYKDVVLNFFKDKKELILSLRSGAELCFDGEFMSTQTDNKTKRVVKVSKAFLDRIKELQKKGYHPYKATVRFTVAWQGKEDDTETAIVLPDLYLKRTE